MFSPQKVDKVNKEKLVFGVRPDQPLPWDPRHELARRKLRDNQTWRHAVYLGIYPLDEVFEVISKVFTPDQDSYDERPTGESAISAFMVNEHGAALLDSPVLSSCAWATGRLVHGARGRGWMSEFEDASREFGAEWLDVVTEEVIDDGDETRKIRLPRPLDHADLSDCLATAVAAAGTGSALSCVEIRISSRIVARRNADSVGHEFLNSFIVNDLGRVAEETATGNIGAALREYLRPEAEIPTAQRIDVRTRVDAVLAATAPDQVPAGRWPSHPEHALALNQQLAVSTAMRMTGSGIMGVNGPPGTGKTTMLRDLVAALVVDRAEKLAALTDPAKAFSGKALTWSTGQRKRVVRQWRRELTGYEMVLASANNGAVQNVTDEIPAADAIDDLWRERAAELDYFPAVATALLAEDPDSDSPRATAANPHGWAVVAARLGNKANRSRFANTFWYYKPDDPRDEHAWSGLLGVLKEFEETGPDRSWSEAVTDFRAVQAKVDSIRDKRATAYRNIERRMRLVNELADLRRAVSVAVARVEVARERTEAAARAEREREAEADRVTQLHRAKAARAAQEHRANAERALDRASVEVNRLVTGQRADAEEAIRSWDEEMRRRWGFHAGHQQTRPGLWERIRTFGATGRQWSQQNSWFASQVHDAEQRLHTARQNLAAVQRTVDAAQQKVGDARRALDAAERELARVPTLTIVHEPLVAARREVSLAERELAAAGTAQTEAERAVRSGEARLAAADRDLDLAASALGRHHPDATWWEDRERRELAALWTDRDWNVARTELFLAALALHKEFLRHTATEMRRNLQAAMDAVSGDLPDEVPGAAVVAAWQSLFFVVPVVSTTFASYARLFGQLGKEALGWLLIDEAGQATPQNAVGALWRTKRAVVVGDPLQLEPVTALPFRAEQAIRNELGVDEQWLTCRTSVQRLADRLTPMGTWVPDEDGKVWVGVPLTVHRRCDQPMFDIVNAIAYDGLMINGTAAAPAEKFAATYPTLPDSKWIDVSGGGSQGHWIPDEGRKLDRILGTLADLEFDMSEVMVIGPFRDIARHIENQSRRYPGLVAGTVHTAQGKQADIVILVLGSDPARVGARRWASSKPNLLNVAVSRAKRRLYVIGNHQEWSKMTYFRTLATALPRT